MMMSQRLSSKQILGAPNRRHPRSRTRSLKVVSLFGFGKKKEEDPDKAEQYQLQQEVLARRRGNTWQKEVVERRKKASRYLNDPEFKKVCDAENREKFKAKMAEMGPEPKFGIIIPIIPLGMPEYDGGERFDLRLPYVDNGWVDEDADFGKQIGRFFGFGKKKDDKKDDKIIKKKKK